MERRDAVLNIVLKTLHYCDSVSHIIYSTITISLLMVTYHNVMKKYFLLFHLVPFSKWRKRIPGTLNKTLVTME